MVEHVQAGEQLLQVRGDEVLQREEDRRATREPGPTGTKRGTLLGTLSRAKRGAPVSGSCTDTARFSDRPLM